MKIAEAWIGVTDPALGNVLVAIESIIVRVGTGLLTIASVEILICED